MLHFIRTPSPLGEDYEIFQNHLYHFHFSYLGHIRSQLLAGQKKCPPKIISPIPPRMEKQQIPKLPDRRKTFKVNPQPLL